MISDLGGIYSGIDKTPNVCGGAARIARTRIPVWLVIRQLQLGLTENLTAVNSIYKNIFRNHIESGYNTPFFEINSPPPEFI